MEKKYNREYIGRKAAIFFLLLLGVIVFFVPLAQAQKKQYYKTKIDICEQLYNGGEYLKALEYSEDLLKKLQNSSAKKSEAAAIPMILMYQAKYLEALARYDLFETRLKASLDMRKEEGENSLKYGLGLLDAAYLYLIYFDLVSAENYLNAAKNVLENRASTGFGEAEEQKDSYFDSQMLFVETSIAFHRGQYAKAERLLPELKKVREQRMSTREIYFDEVTGKFQSRRISKPQFRERKRDYAQVLTLEGEVAREKGDYHKADSIFKATDTWIKQKIHRTGIDLAAVRNTHEALQLRIVLGEDSKDLKRDMERNLFKAERSVGLVHKAYLKAHELLIQHYTEQSYSGLGKKQMWEFKTNTVRYYSDESVPYAIYKRLDAKRRFYGQSNTILGSIRAAFSKRENVLENASSNLRSIQQEIKGIPFNHIERINVLEQLYKVALALHEIDSAESYLNRLLSSKAEIFGKNSIAYHQSRIDLADFYLHHNNDFGQVRAILDQSFHQHLEKELLPNSFSYINALDEYAEYYLVMGQFDSASHMAAKAVKLTAENVGMQHPLYAFALERMVELELDQGEYEEAYSNMDSVLKIYEEIYSKHSSYSFEYAQGLSTAARYYATIGLFNDAKTALNKSERYMRRGDASRVNSEMNDNRMSLLIQTEKLKQAERLVLDAIEDNKRIFGATSRFLIDPYMRMASIYLIDGDYIDAREMVELAYEIAAGAYGETAFKTTQALSLRARVFTELGSYDKAKIDLKQVIETNKATFGENHIQLANAYMELGLATFFSNEEEVEEAEGLIKQALAILASTLGEDNPAYAVGLKTLAQVHTASGKINLAEEELNKANAIWVDKLGSDYNSNSAEIKLLLGDVEVKKKRYDKAEESYDRGRKIYAKLFSKQHPGYITALGRLGRVHYMQKDYKQALKYTNEALADHYRIIEDFFPAMSEGEKSKFWQTIRVDFEFFNTLAVAASNNKKKLIGEMYNNVINTKAILLGNSIKVRNDVLNSGNPVLISTYEEWEEAKEQLIEELSLSPEQQKEEGLDVKNTQKQIENLEKKLGQLSSEFSQNQDASVVTWKEIRNVLQKDEVAVEIIRFRHFEDSFTDSVVYAALILSSKQNNPLIIPLEGGTNLETKFLRYYRACIEYKIEDVFSYKNYWRPIDQILAEGTKVFLSGEGAYNQINLEAVRTDDGEYVIDHSNIVLVTSTKELYTSRTFVKEAASEALDSTRIAAGTNEEIVLIGNPTYYKDLTDEQLLNYDLRSIVQLPGAQTEVTQLNELLLEQTAITPFMKTNRVATEDMLKAIANPKVLHVATHGYFLPDTKDSNDALGQEKANTGALLRSGILMANAGPLMETNNIYEFNKEPGVLTAYEVTSMRLDATELVILSACETARGDVQVGEGVYGLQRSFLIAGADAVMMSLFKVSDEATRSFMVHFYSNWKVKKMDKRTAFIEAKKMLRKEFPEPIFWGPFIMVGSI